MMPMPPTSSEIEAIAASSSSMAFELCSATSAISVRSARRGTRIGGLLPRFWTSEVSEAPSLAAVMVNTFNITQDRIMRSRLAGDPPDVLVSLKVGKVGLFEFHRADELIAMGRAAVRRSSDEILELLKSAGAAV